ncbi:MAG: hypothetical protein WAN35_19935 [Terracidiphilus sp.]
MTTIQLELPDQLAQEAERSGLLSSKELEEWLRAQLKARRWAEFLSTLDRRAAVETDEDFSPEAMAEEVRAMRAERRASQKVA